MTLKRKSASRDILETTKQARHPRRWFHLFFLTLFLALSFFSFTRLEAYESGIARSSFLIQGTYSIPVLEMRPASGETALAAIVAHGFAGSKELMTSFGVELARAGITAYLFDFPGHGASSVAIPANSYNGANEQINLASLSEVVDYVRRHYHTKQSPGIILLGHSMGTGAVGDYAMAHADLLATILVSPVGQQNPTKVQPHNLLQLVGQNDLPYSLSDAARMQRLGCGLPTIQPAPTRCGDVAQGTGRGMVVLPGLNHITILTASSTFATMLSWLHQTDPQQVTLGTMDFDQRLLWLLLTVAGILSALFPLSVLLIDLLKVDGTPRRLNGRYVLFAFACAVLGVSAAIAIQSIWRPFAFLHILLTDYVGGYFFLSAVVMAAAFLLFRRPLPLPGFHQAGRQLLLALLLVVFLYFTLGQISTFAWQRFTLNAPRLWRVPIFFLLLWPIFLFDEGISRGYQEKGLLYAVGASIALKAVLLAGLVASIILIPGLGFLSILLPILALLFVLLVALCTRMYSHGQVDLASATFCALFLAWIMATTFPLTI